MVTHGTSSQANEKHNDQPTSMHAKITPGACHGRRPLNISMVQARTRDQRGHAMGAGARTHRKHPPTPKSVGKAITRLTSTILNITQMIAMAKQAHQTHQRRSELHRSVIHRTWQGPAILPRSMDKRSATACNDRKPAPSVASIYSSAGRAYWAPNSNQHLASIWSIIAPHHHQPVGVSEAGTCQFT